MHITFLAKQRQTPTIKKNNCIFLNERKFILEKKKKNPESWEKNKNSYPYSLTFFIAWNKWKISITLETLMIYSYPFPRLLVRFLFYNCINDFKQKENSLIIYL